MSNGTGRLARFPWLLAGMLAGAGATVGLAWIGLDLFRGEAPIAAGDPPRFAEVTAGIDHVYDGEFQFFVGGGVAVLDCNDDSLPDLYLAGGTNPASLYRNLSDDELRFERVEDPAATVTGVTGAYPLDVDSDGVTDLAVLRVGANLILRGRGDCRFEEANETWGVDGGNDWTVGFSATWEGDASLPTMVFADYLKRDERVCDDHQLLRPRGESYGEPLVMEPGYCTLSALFSDWSRSGRRDLRLANDRHYYTDGEEQLWRFEAGEPPRPFGREDGWEEMRIWGMGIASHDVTGDGHPEVFLTSQGDNKLRTLADGPQRPAYTDIALARGVNAPRPFTGDTSRPSTAWHAEFDDVNNDGFVDLFVTKGNVEEMTGFAAEDPNHLLLGGPDGTFDEAADTAGLLDLERSRGGAVTDLDRDGRLDIVVVERREPVRLWQNRSEAIGNWLGVAPHQDGPNRNAIGAWIEVRVGNHRMEREVTVGGGHAGGELGPLHFGLGHASRADVRVQWPDGQRSDWQTVDANQVVIVRR